MKHKTLLSTAVLAIALAGSAQAQTTSGAAEAPRAEAPRADASPASPDEADQIAFSSDTLDYDEKEDIVTAKGDVHLKRDDQTLRADTVVWNRKTGKVLATGNVVAVNEKGDKAYGDQIDLTDTLKDGVVQNMLVVLSQGGRMAAKQGTRNADGFITVTDAAYTPCDVVGSDNCPKQPTWKITAQRVVYDPVKQRLTYTGARVSVFSLITIPLPFLSHPAGPQSESGLLMPDMRYNGTNGVSFSLPYFFHLAPDRDLTVTPYVYSRIAPMLQVDYRELNALGAFDIMAYGTVSRRSDDPLVVATAATTQEAFRGYINGVGTYQLGPDWTLSGSLRVTTDQTMLRRYEISNDDRLRNNLRLERIDQDSYLSINGWVVETLRLGESEGQQPIALPAIDYRRRFTDSVLGGVFQLQVNTLALERTAGQDTQRAFTSLEWDLRKITPGGQEVILTAFARGDLYNTSDIAATSVVDYRGLAGFHGRAIGALAAEMRWPLIGPAFGGTQHITPRVQVVATPPIVNDTIPNEDSRAVDLEDSNLFALNRFPGYDRFEDGTRVTWGMDYALNLAHFSLDANIGQSYRLTSEHDLFPDGTGLSDRVSDFVGRVDIHYGSFFTITDRYRIDKDSLKIRRNEVDATIGTKSTYLLLGYLALNRNIDPALEDLTDGEEARVGARIQLTRFWSIYGSTLIDLTTHSEDPTSLANGFDPVRHRVGLTYEDGCLRLGLAWKREYQDTGDAKAGNSFLLSLSFKNLGR